MEQQVCLVRPTAELKDSYLQGLREFRQEAIPWALTIDLHEVSRDFGKFVDSELNKKTSWTVDDPVAETELWAVVEGEFAGRVAIRHQLNADLRIKGGHIGYDTRPTYRRRGIATFMLSQALVFAKQLGISEALLTCNEDNWASIRVMEKNGGVLREQKTNQTDGLLRRYYWFSL